MELQIELAGLKMRYPVMNASGIFSFPPVLKRLVPYFGAVVTKSIGIEKRPGNETPVFAQINEDTYINAVGLPNPGYKEMRKELERVYPIVCDGQRVPIIGSFIGSKKDEISTIIRHTVPVLDAVELNLSCPHDRVFGKAVCSDVGLVHILVEAARDATEKPIIAKLPANIDNFLEVAHAADKGGADAFAAVNTYGPVSSEYDGVQLLSSPVGGLSGRFLKKHGLEAVRKLRGEFPTKPIIGMGGIYTAEDVAEYLYCGADAVAIGTAFDLMSTNEITEYMNDLYGKLREMNV